MYFKKLEILGFKSFADKITMNFGPGITAVIGPNGCGKSNIFDAIRWVLGEQSVKELRGNSMEDVIFNGTDKKSALGFAEVNLTFSNESKTLPIEYDEVTVTRRLFRSGESEYLINKSAVRLKDIVELFLGTGIGAEAYSLVQQGRVDLIVSARPDDRRIIFDEAAGITKYKAKKREAINKLKDTENNLLRINDIIVEVKRQISSLERQANKAKKYRVEFEKLKNLEVQVANYQIGECSFAHQEVEKTIAELKQKEEESSRELEELNDLLTRETEFFAELEERVNELKAEDIKLDGQRDIANRQIGFDVERIENIQNNQQRIVENKEDIKAQCLAYQEKIDELKQLLSIADEVMLKSLDDLNSKKELLEAIARFFKHADEYILVEEQKILEVTASQVRLKNMLTDSMKEIQGCLARKRRLELENTKVVGEREDVDQRLRDILFKVEQSSGKVHVLREDVSQKRLTLEALTQQLTVLQEDIDELEKKKLFLISQKEFIEKLSVQYEDMPDPIVAGRFYTDTPPKQEFTGLIGKVKSVLEADNERAKALKDSFGEDVKTIYELVCETKFIELDPLQITAKIEDLNRCIAEKIVEREDLTSRLDEQKATVQQQESMIQEEEKELSIHEAQRQNVISECTKLNEELGLISVELQEVNEQLVCAKQKEEQLNFDLDTLNQDLINSQEHIKSKRDEMALQAKSREETTVAIAQLETEINSCEDKKKGYFENVEMFQNNLDSQLDAMTRLDNEYTDCEERKTKCHQDIENLNLNLLQIDGQKQSLQGVLGEQKRQTQEVSQRIASVKQNIVSYTEDLENLRNQLHEQQMKLQEIGFKEKEINDRLIQSYKIDLQEYNKSQERDAEESEQAASENAEIQSEVFDLDATLLAIERLKKRCDSFGSVNLVAIEEFEELRERFEFLTKQQSDLITAQEALYNTIRNINRQTRQMFMNTFTKVSEEFRIYFRMLFGGGEARLVLLDPENVLESGIEIIARPPGKKRQAVSLLSGGEKTLTAIALIFGVFKVNPSPFCVLDEIDAALDESNVGRYAYLLKDFSKIAQFIIITHNKKTIESADVMYGITMEETGVSKVVSVKLTEKGAAEVEKQEPVEVGV